MILRTIEVDEYSSVFILNIEDNKAYIDKKLIPLEQLEEIDSYKKVQDRDKRLISRTFLFTYLKENYGISCFQFSYISIKRPIIEAIEVDFNISYSKDLIAVAVTTDGKIGVDIEYLDSSWDIKSIVPVCMNSSECKEFESLKGNEKIEYFYSLWTYKEALSKYHGEGLYLDIKNIISQQENNLCKYHTFLEGKYSLSVVKNI